MAHLSISLLIATAAVPSALSAQSPSAPRRPDLPHFVLTHNQIKRMIALNNFTWSNPIVPRSPIHIDFEIPQRAVHYYGGRVDIVGQYEIKGDALCLDLGRKKPDCYNILHFDGLYVTKDVTHPAGWYGNIIEWVSR